jgi:prepilin signal peptidase PulO-like enzyme (type II secretory pathway)
VLAGLTADSAVELLWLVALLSVLVVLSVYDYYHLIIPDRLTVYVSVLIGGWWVYLVYVGERTAVDALTALALAFAAAIFFFLLWLGTRGRALGFGDVKLALPLGLLATAGTASVAGATSAGVGAGSMAAAAFSFVALSFWVGAIISLSYLAISALRAHKRGQPHLPGQPRLTMKSAVPFGPFMVIGALLVYVFHVNVLQLFSFM